MKRFLIFSIVLFTQQIIAQKTDPMAAYKAAIRAQQKKTGMPLSTDMPFLNGNALPVKNPKVLASIPKSTLNETQLQTYIQKTVSGVTKKVSAKALKDAETLAEDLKKKCPTSNYLSNAAKMLLVIGSNESALVLLGKAVLQDPSNADNLNNYSAALIQHGGGHLALPILQALNARFPGNSTILNNIGQAWFSIGDFSQASQYFDISLKIFPMQSMTNYTKAIIEESNGNKPEALKNMMISIKAAYSDDKYDRIENMGGKLSSDDISWNIPMKEDEMGLDKFISIRPNFYFSRVDIESLGPKWAAFLEASVSKIGVMTKEMMALQSITERNSKACPNILANKAAKLRSLVAEKEEQTKDLFFNKIGVLNERFEKIRTSLTADLEIVARNFPPPVGRSESDEEFRLHQAAICNAYRKAGDQLFNLNKDLNSQITPFLAELRSILNDKTYFSKYSYDSQLSFNIEELSNQTEFLGLLAAFSNGMTGQIVSQPMCIDCGIIIENGDCSTETKKVNPITMSLPNFDSIPYDTKEIFSIGCNSYYLPCKDDSIKLDDEISMLRLKLDPRENWVRESSSKNFEFLVSSSELSKNGGPISAEASEGSGVFWESSDKGFSDFGMIHKENKSGKFGLEGRIPYLGSVGKNERWVLKSGPSMTVNSLLSGYIDF